MPRIFHSVSTMVLTFLLVMAGYGLSSNQASAKEACNENICITTTGTNDHDITIEQNGRQLKAFLEAGGYKLLSTNVIDVIIKDEVAEKNQLRNKYQFISSIFSTENNDLGYLTYWKDSVHNFMMVSTGDLRTYMVKGKTVQPVTVEEIKQFIPDSLSAMLHPVDHGVTKQVKDATSLAVSCKTAKGYYEKRNLLGTEIMYRWWQEKYFCYDGTYLSGVNVQSYATNISAAVNYYGESGRAIRTCGSSLSQCHESDVQGKFENIVPAMGPVGYSYPWVRINCNGQGYFTVGSWE